MPGALAAGAADAIAEHSPALILVTTQPSDRALKGWEPWGPGWIDARDALRYWARRNGEHVPD
jgi:hypothetical protein